MHFQYGPKEITHLKNRDQTLGRAIEQIGHIHRAVESDLFCSIVRHIIGQQISTRAQETIWQRLRRGVGTVNAGTICTLELPALQQYGMTFKKAEYIKGIAEKVKNKDLDLRALRDLPDAAVIKELTSLKGVGVWTAEMVMIFGMQRPDIVSYGDLGIRRGMRMLYRLKELDRNRFAQYAKRYTPHGSVASLYLWAVAGGAIPELQDPAKQSDHP